MSEPRNNHYVPEWYQKGFLLKKGGDLRYLDLTPDKKVLPNGRVITFHDRHWWSPSRCFCQTDLYTTFFGSYVNVEVETKLFGGLDDAGARAVEAYIKTDMSGWHKYFTDLFSYIDIQKIRTPKGLQWIKEHYPNLSQVELMVEMQAIRNMNCTIWTEGVREIVSAANSKTKFIVSDHPITIYNYLCPPESSACAYPNDPQVALKGSQTIFPLNKDYCLILTNYEYAQDPKNQNPTERRTHARNFRNSIVRTDAFIRSRLLNEDEVRAINLIIKKRARRYIAAAEEDWLYPERYAQSEWDGLRQVLLPPENELWKFGGETYIGYEDGSTHYQDAFGRTQPESKHLKKPKRDKPPKPNDLCGCGGARKYKKCCMHKPLNLRPSWEELSILDRNITFANGINSILGLSKNKTWLDVRRELSDEQVIKIHELFGFLWPLETDLYSLLPKPDGEFRALYTGIVDPRTIRDFAVPLIPYFDEIIIQNPFMNPWSIKPEYSPIHSPHQYKLQTLKNVLLYMTLMPFIAAGYINLIPDPCAFDFHLRQQMHNMAEERARGYSIGSKDKELLEWLHRDDFQRTLLMLPKEQQIYQVKKVFSKFSEEETETFLKYSAEMKENDPLSLLQEDALSKQRGGQMQMFSMSPNFEISLLIAQVTGSLLLTDREFRWQEMQRAQSRPGGIVTYNWGSLTDVISEKEYVLNADLDATFRIRKEGKFNSFRETIGRIYSEMQSDVAPSRTLVKNLKAQFLRAQKAAFNEANKVEGDKYMARFTSIMPLGGIVHNNVQRMLLSGGYQNYLKSVPMAIYVEPSPLPES